jgi:hypothetical protein
MTNEEILKLAKTCGFKELIDENVEIDDEYWGCWEQQLLKFALAIHEDGYNKGYEQCSFDMGDENV